MFPAPYNAKNNNYTHITRSYKILKYFVISFPAFHRHLTENMLEFDTASRQSTNVRRKSSCRLKFDTTAILSRIRIADRTTISIDAIWAFAVFRTEPDPSMPKLNGPFFYTTVCLVCPQFLPHFWTIFSSSIFQATWCLLMLAFIISDTSPHSLMSSSFSVRYAKSNVSGICPIWFDEKIVVPIFVSLFSTRLDDREEEHSGMAPVARSRQYADCAFQRPQLGQHPVRSACCHAVFHFDRHQSRLLYRSKIFQNYFFTIH